MTIDQLKIPKGVDQFQVALNMGFYYDYLTLTGTDVVMSDLLSRLAPLPKKDALRALSSMAAWLSRPGNMLVRPQVEAAKAILPRNLADAYATKLHEEMTKAGPGIVFHLQQIRFVLQWAIICCKDDSPSMPEEELRTSIGACCLIASRIMMKIDECIRPPAADMDGEERDLFQMATFLPIGEIYRKGLIHERAAALWFGAARSQSAAKAVEADIAGAFERTYGLPFREFYLVLTSAWLAFNAHHYNGVSSPLLVDVDDQLKTVVRPEYVERSLDLISQTTDELAIRLLGTRQSWSTDMTPFVDRPLIRLEPGKLCCPDLLMLQRALVDRVASLLDGAYPRGRFQEVFGPIYEEYLRSLLASFGTESDTVARTYFPSPAFVGKPPRQAGDAIYVGADVVAVFEAKVSRLSPRQKYGAGPEELRKAIVDGLGSEKKGIGQLAKVLKGLMAGEAIHVGTDKTYDLSSRRLYYPIIAVHDESFTGNAVRTLLQGEFDALLAKNGVDDSKVAPLMILDTRDVELMAGAAANDSLASVLSKYAAYLSKMEGVPSAHFEPFMAKEFPKVLPFVDSSAFEVLRTEIEERYADRTVPPDGAPST